MSLTEDISSQIQPVFISNAIGMIPILRTGALVTTTTTTNQIILTYTVTAGKTLYLEYFDFNVRLSTYASVATNFGTISLENPAGTKLYTNGVFNTGSSINGLVSFSQPITISAGSVIRLVCTPSAITSFTWWGNIGGYEI